MTRGPARLLLLASMVLPSVAFQISGPLSTQGHHRALPRVFWFGGGNKANDDWKEEAYREQQRILAERQRNGGFISEEAEEAISSRRRKLMEESKALKEVQSGGEGADQLERWKELRDSGKIKTA